MKFDLQSKIVTPKKEDTAYVINSFASSSDAVTQINIELLIPYEGQPFKPYSEEKLLELAEDIKINGVLSPVIVRPVENGKYQILAGHNRTDASKLVGLTTIPAIIKPCDDITAMLIVVNTNLNQRQELLPSEKAFAYKMQLEAMKRQAGRPKENGRQVVDNFKTADIIGQSNNESGRQIQRYIRLTYLFTSFLDMIDNNKLPFMVGVNLSYLSESNQLILFSIINDNKLKISLKQSEQLKELNAEGDFTLELLDEFFNPSENNSTKAKKGKRSLKLTDNQCNVLLELLQKQKNAIDQAVYTELLAILQYD